MKYLPKPNRELFRFKTGAEYCRLYTFSFSMDNKTTIRSVKNALQLLEKKKKAWKDNSREFHNANNRNLYDTLPSAIVTWNHRCRRRHRTLIRPLRAETCAQRLHRTRPATVRLRKCFMRAMQFLNKNLTVQIGLP